MNETISEIAIERRLRVAALLTMSGLGVEAFSFGWHHPTAFIVFVGVGGALLGAGVLSFLFLILLLSKGG